MNSVDTAMQIVAALQLDNGQRWGDVAEPFQWEDARAVLDNGPTPYHFLTRPRGASKTTDLAAIAIGALLAQAPAGARCFAAAADQAQAALLLDALAGFVMRSPSLRAYLRVETKRVTNTRNGASLEALAADVTSTFSRVFMAAPDSQRATVHVPGGEFGFFAKHGGQPRRLGRRRQLSRTF